MMILELDRKFFLFFIENARRAYLELFSNEFKIPNFHDDLDEQFEMSLGSIQNSNELCSSSKQYKNKQRKPLWFNK